MSAYGVTSPTCSIGLPPCVTDQHLSPGVMIGRLDAAGLHRTHISLIERGRRSVRIETIRAQAVALGVQPADLMLTIRLGKRRR